MFYACCDSYLVKHDLKKDEIIFMQKNTLETI